ncbi:MAG: alpha/beta hydrolase [Candidatus Promineifilaceae bacterium]|nr:alpha/beta hydrolase [Candidatus Promineifilaceae bacterium]
MSVQTLLDIKTEPVTTRRLSTRVLFSGDEEGTPVLFIHGNITSATWWEEIMIDLPPQYRGVAADQRGFGEADISKKVDATRGLAQLADDNLALLDQLGYEKAHIVGNSLGGSILWWMLVAAPSRFLSATVVAPGSPFGFGGTKDLAGTPCFDDFAGSGAGLSKNPEVVRLVREGYRGIENMMGLRFALRTMVYKPPFVPEREEDLLSAALSIHVGDQDWPGDVEPSVNWPYFAPGRYGIVNALSSKYAFEIEELLRIDPKPDILWIRGSDDKAVADNAASDPANLGALGFLPDYPGAEVYPPQPMIGQTRAVLDQYESRSGSYQEIIMEDTAHVPFIEKREEFNRLLHQHLRKNN